MQLFSGALLCLALTWPAAPLIAQTTPPSKSQSSAASVTTTTESRVNQYFTDLTQRLRDVYFAPSDARAIALLSTGTTEFGARKKALLTEIARANASERKALTQQLRNSAWQKEIEAIQNSTAATKLAEHSARNPTLQMALQRFTDAQITDLTILPAD
jgi:hypothetical protein